MMIITTLSYNLFYFVMMVMIKSNDVIKINIYVISFGINLIILSINGFMI